MSPEASKPRTGLPGTTSPLFFVKTFRIEIVKLDAMHS